MTNWAKILIDLSFYPCWDTLSKYTSLWKECPACLFSAFNTYWLFSQALTKGKIKTELILHFLCGPTFPARAYSFPATIPRCIMSQALQKYQSSNHHEK